MLRLKDQDLEHRTRIKRRPSSLRTVPIAKPFDESNTEILKINRLIEDVKRIAVFTQTLKMIG